MRSVGWALEKVSVFLLPILSPLEIKLELDSCQYLTFKILLKTSEGDIFLCDRDSLGQSPAVFPTVSSLNCGSVVTM